MMGLMSKPIVEVELETLGGLKGRARAVFDSGSHSTLIREDCLPKGALLERREKPLRFKTAARGGTLDVVGGVVLIIKVGDRLIRDEALVSPDLSQEMIIGAGTMQKWDITLRNTNGRTQVEIPKDLNDPDFQEVD